MTIPEPNRKTLKLALICMLCGPNERTIPYTLAAGKKDKIEYTYLDWDAPATMISPPFQELSKELLSVLPPTKRLHRKNHQRALQGLLVGALLNPDGFYLSRNEHFYEDKRCPVSYAAAMRCVDALIAAGLLTETKGNNHGNGTPTLEVPTANLIALTETGGEIMYKATGEKGVVLRAHKEYKDKPGKQKEYRETANTKKWTAELKIYNNLLRKTKLSLQLPYYKERILPYRPTFRVFNVDWEHGGRFYGGRWQSIKSEERAWIHIDGEPTVEYDYSGMLPRIALAQVGTVVHPDKDIYDCLPVGQEFNGYPEMLKAIERAYPELMPLFYTGVGLKLQTVDSEIARRVINSGAEKGIVILPIHDSFIVKEKHYAYLLEIMEKHYTDVVGSPPSIH